MLSPLFPLAYYLFSCAIILLRFCADRAQVNAFHEAALQAGGKDHGAPGIRKEYHPDYYGAFAISPAGHNIEAVTQVPE